MKYPKIQTVYKRVLESGPDKGKLIEGAWTLPEFDILQNVKWEATEKIDGTNVRIYWDAEKGQVTFKGRRENPLEPPSLVAYLTDTFTVSRFASSGVPSGIYFGEGYGAKIQKPGKLYKPDGEAFMLFDIFVTHAQLWLERFNVRDIAEQLGIDAVPVLEDLTPHEAIEWVKGGFLSAVGVGGEAGFPTAEGLVLRAPRGMLNRRGGRIITKIKTKDFVRGYAKA